MAEDSEVMADGGEVEEGLTFDERALVVAGFLEYADGTGEEHVERVLTTAEYLKTVAEIWELILSGEMVIRGVSDAGEVYLALPKGGLVKG